MSLRKQPDRSTVYTVWTIYQNPSDFPGLYVARPFDIGPDGSVTSGEAAMLATEIGPLRAEMETRGLYCVPRQPHDDPVVVETWL